MTSLRTNLGCTMKFY